jgi:hypothetical protein
MFDKNAALEKNSLFAQGHRYNCNLPKQIILTDKSLSGLSMLQVLK